MMDLLCSRDYCCAAQSRCDIDSCSSQTCSHTRADSLHSLSNTRPHLPQKEKLVKIMSFDGSYNKPHEQKLVTEGMIKMPLQNLNLGHVLELNRNDFSSFDEKNTHVV